MGARRWLVAACAGGSSHAYTAGSMRAAPTFSLQRRHSRLGRVQLRSPFLSCLHATGPFVADRGGRRHCAAAHPPAGHRRVRHQEGGGLGALLAGLVGGWVGACCAAVPAGGFCPLQLWLSAAGSDANGVPSFHPLLQAISNATSGGTNEQIKYLVSQVRANARGWQFVADPAAACTALAVCKPAMHIFALPQLTLLRLTLSPFPLPLRRRARSSRCATCCPAPTPASSPWRWRAWRTSSRWAEGSMEKVYRAALVSRRLRSCKQGGPAHRSTMGLACLQRHLHRFAGTPSA